MKCSYLSLAMRSLAIRCLASVTFDSRYWPVTYATPTTPHPMAKPVRFRRSHLLVEDIIPFFASMRNVTNVEVEVREQCELATAFKGLLDVVVEYS